MLRSHWKHEHGASQSKGYVLCTSCKDMTYIIHFQQLINIGFPGRSLSHNSFTSTLPPFPPRLEVFSATRNNFEGTIPALPKTMVYLHLASNILSGSAPDASEDHSVIYVNLDDNRLADLPTQFAAQSALYLSIARNQINGALPSFDTLSSSLVYCDLSGNRFSGHISGVASGSQNWSYLALDSNILSGSLPMAWQANVSVLLLQNNRITGCLPRSWATNGSLTVLGLSNNSMSCPDGIPESWVTGRAFQNLSLVSLYGNKGLESTPVPSSLFAEGNIKDNTRVLLGWGELLKASAKDRKWQKQVCIHRSFNDRLKTVLNVKLGQPVLAAVQVGLGAAVARMKQNISTASQSRLTFLDVGSAGFRLGTAKPFSLDDICGNPSAATVVLVQWVVVGACLLLLVAAHVLEAKWRAFSRLYESLGGCQPNKSGTRGTWFIAIGKTGALRHLAGLMFYWYDIVLDIILLHEVMASGASLGYGLLVVLVAHYVVLALLVTWRCVQATMAQRLLASLLALPLAPLTPLLDTVTFLVMATQHAFKVGSMPAATSWLIHLDMQSEEWVVLFETREVLEVVLEAIPTAVLQSVVFVAGNSPSLGIYLDRTLYILSSAGSSIQILKLAATIVWVATQQRKSVWRVLLDRVSGKT
jgi:hypothetical protein